MILNLAIWFAVHTLFRETVSVRTALLAFDAPRLKSVDLWSLAISVAAAVAIFRFKVGNDHHASRVLSSPERHCMSPV